MGCIGFQMFLTENHSIISEFQGIICIFTRHKDVFAKRNERAEPWVFILHSHVAKRQITFSLKETFYIGHYNQVAAILTVLLCSLHTKLHITFHNLLVLT